LKASAEKPGPRLDLLLARKLREEHAVLLKLNQEQKVEVVNLKKHTEDMIAECKKEMVGVENRVKEHVKQVIDVLEKRVDEGKDDMTGLIKEIEKLKDLMDKVEAGAAGKLRIHLH
jgi:low affinity Fe/Cu permease